MLADKFDAWLQAFVNTDKFAQDLQATILMVEKPEVKARLMLELIDFIKPKVKTVDAPTAEEKRSINITFVQDNTPTNE